MRLGLSLAPISLSIRNRKSADYLAIDGLWIGFDFDKLIEDVPFGQLKDTGALVAIMYSGQLLLLSGKRLPSKR
jgi:hypothetical protein